MNNLIGLLKLNSIIQIKNEKSTVKTKTWYSIEEDPTTSYVKCELSNNKVLVIIPEDELIYIGTIVENMNYKKLPDDKIEYNNKIFNKTGEGHQFIKEIEFGNEKEIEGKCIFEDYESENEIISLGILPDKDNTRADVYADILNLDDIKVIK